MISTFSEINKTTVANFSTTLETNYFTAYGTWGANEPANMELKFTCKQLIEPCKLAYSIRGGVIGTSFSQDKQKWFIFFFPLNNF